MYHSKRAVEALHLNKSGNTKLQNGSDATTSGRRLTDCPCAGSSAGSTGASKRSNCQGGSRTSDKVSRHESTWYHSFAVFGTVRFVFYASLVLLHAVHSTSLTAVLFFTEFTNTHHVLMNAIFLLSFTLIG